jgi:DNA methylase
MTPYLADPDVTLYHGDALEILREFPAGSVDCCVTSPPYWGLRDYGTGLWEGGDPNCDHTVSLGDGGAAPVDERVAFRTGKQYTHQKVAGNVCQCGAQRTDRQLGLEPTPDEYVTQMVEVFREVRRVLAAHGTCWINLGDSYANDGKWGGSTGGKHVEALYGSAGLGRQKVTTGLKPKDLVGIPWRVARALQEPYYTGRIKDERDRIWLAATVEAEGCMFIHRRKAGTDSGAKYTKKDGTEVSYARTQDTFGAGLEVASTDRIVAERCMEITGIGSICEQTPGTNPRRKQTIYRWNVRSNECRWIIQELYPHLLAKKHEARLLLGCPPSGDSARKAWASLKALHQGQSADIDFREPEGMWEEGWFLRSDIIWAKLCPTQCLNRSQTGPRKRMSTCSC